MFHKRFVPIYFKSIAQPWTINDLVAVTTMQKIWTTVYGKTITCTISTNSPIFAIVSIFIYILHISMSFSGPTMHLRFLAFCHWLYWALSG